MSALDDNHAAAVLPSQPSAVVGPRDPHVRGWRCWLRTTTGIVLMLLFVQFFTGLLLGFYYVPAVDHAHATVSFIEKVLPSGAWIRAVHHHGSQWLPLFLFFHLVQLFWRAAYRIRKTLWVGAVLLLALVMSAGATGYSLPWDARAFFSTRVAEGIVSGLPLVGNSLRSWLLGGAEISTLTLSRFFALHVFVTPFLMLSVIVWQLLSWRAGTPDDCSVGDGLTGSKPFRFPGSGECTRNAISATLAFVALAAFAYKFPAPLGPAASMTGPDYLPRPGLQFLWLYQTLKYVPGALGSVVGVVLPGVFVLLLAALPWLNAAPLRRFSNRPRRRLGALVLFLPFLLVVTTTVLSFVNDRRDPRTRQQLAKQAAEEAGFRRQPFVPKLTNESSVAVGPTATLATAAQAAAPPAFKELCANCHGEHGEGAQQGKLKFPALLGVSEKPRRSVDDIVSLLNDPKTYGLEAPMKSFATKLTEQEKHEIAEWVVRLRK